MIPDRRTYYRKCLMMLLPLFLMGLGAAGPAGAQTCGDLDDSGGPANATDLTLLTNYLYVSGDPFPAPLWVADMDGVPGITANDHLTLIDHLYTSFTPLDCNVTADSTFPASGDTLEFRNTTVPAGTDEWAVEVWLQAQAPYVGISLPLVFDCATSALTLDSIQSDGDQSKIDNGAQKLLLVSVSSGGPAGEQLLARLFFSLTPDGSEQEILIDTTDYPPSHTTVVSRVGTADHTIDGFVPGLLLPETAVCGDMDGSGDLSISDVTFLTNYLYITGPAPDPLWVADMDGVPGVTGNDFYTFIDHWYISHAPLDCSVTPDSSFQHSEDTIKIRYATVGAMELNPHVVEVWLKASDEFFALHLPLSYEFTPSPITLDSVVGENGHGGHIDPVEQRVLISGSGSSPHPPGEQLIASLYFTITSPVIENHDIVFDTTAYPPSHTTVLSRAGVDRAIDGFVPAFVIVPADEGCLADGDVNDNGTIEIGDLTSLTNYIYLGGAAPDPLYRADVTGDCVIDSLDIVALACYAFGSCDDPPVLPVSTCCYPRVFAPGDTALAIGKAALAFNGDTMFVNMARDDGSDGVRIYGDETRSRGISLELINADLSNPNAGLAFEISGYVEGSEKMPQGSMQAMASVGIWNNGSGALQVYGDFSPAGDPNVLVEVYVSGFGMTGSATVPGGGLIAFGNEYNGGGLPSVTKAAFQTAAPPTFSARLSVPTQFTLVGGPVLVGDSIQLIGANANSITHCSTFDLNGLHITFLGLINIKTNACCRGFTGNVDCDNVDVVDVTDIQVLIDNLFLTLTPLCCEKETNFNYPGSGYTETDNIVDITDLSILIDNQFLTLTPLPSCP